MRRTDLTERSLWIADTRGQDEGHRTREGEESEQVALRTNWQSYALLQAAALYCSGIEWSNEATRVRARQWRRQRLLQYEYIAQRSARALSVRAVPSSSQSGAAEQAAGKQTQRQRDT